jgi:rare lipoprotein A
MAASICAIRRVGRRASGCACAASTYAGRVTAFRASLASWFTDAGATACGFHAYYGVANKSLPCGTKVTFHYGGRSVTATVEDRGPYAGGREWDLNQNTARALGFGGVGTVWSSI